MGNYLNIYISKFVEREQQQNTEQIAPNSIPQIIEKTNRRYHTNFIRILENSPRFIVGASVLILVTDHTGLGLSRSFVFSYQSFSTDHFGFISDLCRSFFPVAHPFFNITFLISIVCYAVLWRSKLTMERWHAYYINVFLNPKSQIS